MAKFLSQLEVEYIDAATRRLTKPLVYQSDILGECVIVPKGFKTNFASVPRFLPLAYALFGDTAHRAAALHDWLYSEECSGVARADADAVFLEAMQSEKMSWWRRGAMWLGVRALGWAFKARRQTTKEVNPC